MDEKPYIGVRWPPLRSFVFYKNGKGVANEPPLHFLLKCMNEGNEQSKPVIRYIKYDHDIPKQYCCRAMREGIEEIEFIEYCERFDEYTFSSYNGYPFSRMRYCPYCGKEIASLRPLFSVKYDHYLYKKKWQVEEIERYWDLYRQGKSQEEAERIVEQERESLPSQE